MKGHVRLRGSTWYAVLDVLDAAGKRRRKFHRLKAGGKREAQAACAKLIAELKAGAYVEPTRLTVDQYLRSRLEQWVASGSIGAKTAERYAELIANQITPHIGAKSLQKLRAIDIEAWHNTLATAGRKDGQGGVSTRTIGHCHRILVKALREAARFDLVTRNVAAVQRPPKVEQHEEVQIVAAHQMEDLLTKLRRRTIYPKVVTALFTGLRRGELLALRWSHVDLDAKTLQVREALEETKAGVNIKAPKTRAGRRDIALPDVVVDALREHRRSQLELRLKLGLGKLSDNDHLFATIDGRLPSPRAFSAEWADVAASIGMPGVTFHALRHTHASQLIAAGVDVVTISKRLGHASPNITLSVYAHMFKQRDDRAAAAINAALANFKPIG
jgi:integrase